MVGDLSKHGHWPELSQRGNNDGAKRTLALRGRLSAALRIRSAWVPGKEQPSSDAITLSDLDRFQWVESIRFNSFGVRVGVRVDRSGVLNRIEPFLPPGWKPSRSRNVDRVYSVLVRGKGDFGLGRFKVVYADGV